MKELNYNKLREELVRILEQYLKEPNNALIKNKLIGISNYYFNSFPILDKESEEALSIGEELNCFQNISNPHNS